MGFDEFLARINNRRKRMGEYGRVLGGVGKEALAMEVETAVIGVNRLD